MFKLKIAAIVGGGMLAYFGYQELQISSNTSSEALPVNLAELETGEVTLENNFIQLNDIWGVTPEMVYYYEYPEGASADDVKPEYKVDYCYLPLISQTHSYNVACDALIAKYPDGNIPADEEPKFESFAVLLKTNDYKTIGDLPENWLELESIEGMVINQINSFKEDEKTLILGSFPNLDFDKVLVLEKDRQPSSPVKSYGMIGGGGLLSIAGLLWLIVGFKKPRE